MAESVIVPGPFPTGAPAGWSRLGDSEVDSEDCGDDDLRCGRLGPSEVGVKAKHYVQKLNIGPLSVVDDAKCVATVSVAVSGQKNSFSLGLIAGEGLIGSGRVLAAMENCP